jgi:aminoglycoside N3'-acetyltransferase
MNDYLDRLVDAIGAVVEPYDTLVFYSDFRFLISRPEIALQRDAFQRGLVERLIATGKTFLTPAYSYTTEGDFNIETTPTRVSAIARWLVGNPVAARSEHPLFSYVAFGAGRDIVRNIGKSAFGAESVYDRLGGRKAGFLHLGRPVVLGNSIIHHVEQACGATYRINKAFRTRVFRNRDLIGTDYSAFLRRRDVDGNDFAFDFTLGAEELDKRGLVRLGKTAPDDAYLAVYSFDAARQALVELFHRNPSAFIRSPYIQY